MERTLVLIKPDAVGAHHIGDITKAYEEAGLDLGTARGDGTRRRSCDCTRARAARRDESCERGRGNDPQALREKWERERRSRIRQPRECGARGTYLLQ